MTRPWRPPHHPSELPPPGLSLPQGRPPAPGPSYLQKLVHTYPHGFCPGPHASPRNFPEQLRAPSPARSPPLSRPSRGLHSHTDGPHQQPRHLRAARLSTHPKTALLWGHTALSPGRCPARHMQGAPTSHIPARTPHWLLPAHSARPTAAHRQGHSSQAPPVPAAQDPPGGCKGQAPGNRQNTKNFSRKSFSKQKTSLSQWKRRRKAQKRSSGGQRGRQLRGSPPRQEIQTA